MEEVRPNRPEPSLQSPPSWVGTLTMAWLQTRTRLMWMRVNLNRCRKQRSQRLGRRLRRELALPRLRALLPHPPWPDPQSATNPRNRIRHPSGIPQDTGIRWSPQPKKLPRLGFVWPRMCAYRWQRCPLISPSRQWPRRPGNRSSGTITARWQPQWRNLLAVGPQIPPPWRFLVYLLLPTYLLHPTWRSSQRIKPPQAARVPWIRRRVSHQER